MSFVIIDVTRLMTQWTDTSLYAKFGANEEKMKNIK